MSKDNKPNADMLRHDIDKGRTGDKKGFPDPSAAPLGTDAEAGGSPPSREELRVAREAERQRPDDEEGSRRRPTSGGGD